VSARVSVLIGAPVEQEGCTGDCDVCRSLRQALLRELARRSPGAPTAAGVARRAGLTEADLVAHYGGLEGCLGATYDQLAAELYELHVDAFDGPGDWRSRFLTGVRAGLERIASVPGAVRLLFADELRAHPGLRERRAMASERVARLVADELELEWERDVPDLQVEFMLGAALHAVQAEAVEGVPPAHVTARVGQTLSLLEPKAA
jgi:AcrR family transcriptional regulator